MARDLAAIELGLRAFLPDGDRISGVAALSTGHSNETYLLEGSDLVLRMPPSEVGLLPPYDMAKQHAIFREVASHTDAPPVPSVRELCLDPSVIGDPFFIMNRVLGTAFEYELPAWLTDGSREVRSSVCEQWIGAVCDLPALGPLDALGPPRSPRDEAVRWREMAAGAGANQLADVINELVEEPPPMSGSPTLVWGDSKLANVLWDEGRLVALVDFELAYNGDPLADLGYVLFWFPEDPALPRLPGFELDGMWGRERVIDTWQRRTGRSALGVELHEAAAIGKIAAIFAAGGRLYQEGLSTDERIAGWARGADRLMTFIRQRIDFGRERIRSLTEPTTQMRQDGSW
jgi:aminoglycoside phosphotransferase (APT) family kinase protein